MIKMSTERYVGKLDSEPLPPYEIQIPSRSFNSNNNNNNNNNIDETLPSYNERLPGYTLVDRAILVSTRQLDTERGVTLAWTRVDETIRPNLLRIILCLIPMLAMVILMIVIATKKN